MPSDLDIRNGIVLGSQSNNTVYVLRAMCSTLNKLKHTVPVETLVSNLIGIYGSSNPGPSGPESATGYFIFEVSSTGLPQVRWVEGTNQSSNLYEGSISVAGGDPQQGYS